jgi:probable rRNA maturation factor
MKHLNETVVKHEGVTDVLSFPHHEKDQLHDWPLPAGVPPQLGEIVICFPVAVKEAKTRGKMVDAQLKFYLEHGLMHLLGHHHNDGMS